MNPIGPRNNLTPGRRPSRRPKKNLVAPAISAEVNRAISKHENKIKAHRRGKLFPTIVNALSITASGNINELSNVTQGVALAQRVGDRIIPTKLVFRISVSAPDAFNTSRFIVFRWRPNNTTAVTVANILELGVGGVPSPYSELSFINRENIDVLYDSGLFSQVLYTAGASSGNLMFQFEVSCHNRPITYNATVTSGVDKIFLLTISDSVAGPDPVFTGACYLYFHDDEL